MKFWLIYVLHYIHCISIPSYFDQLWFGRLCFDPKRPKSQTSRSLASLKTVQWALSCFWFELKNRPAANLRLFLRFPCKISSDSNPRIRLSRLLPFLPKLPLLLSALQKLSLFLFSFSSFAMLLLRAFSTMEAMLLIPFNVFMIAVNVKPVKSSHSLV